MEELVSGVLSKFEGELGGKYYSLKTMSKEDQNQLIADHFLFKEGDRFLEACGLNRNWPEGRGIFHNDDKTFLVWVNEEDQLRIISMQPGSDIGELDLVDRGRIVDVVLYLCGQMVRPDRAQIADHDWRDCQPFPVVPGILGAGRAGQSGGQ